MDIKSKIRVIEDYPAKGISFKDITTLIHDKEAFNYTIDLLAEKVKDYDFDYVVAIEARGFIFGSALSYKLNKGLVLVRKPGKLPFDTIKESYELEYGTDSIEMHADSLKKGDKVLIIDDLLATGGTSLACAKLVEKAGATVSAIEFIVELESLKARDLLKDYNVVTLEKYDH
ncbi:MAG: adenine phosphoribosyltransferase [Tissierellia bacterium]|nr:adenine phosphoribosyltransferase [Tissierellia bacterium]